MGMIYFSSVSKNCLIIIFFCSIVAAAKAQHPVRIDAHTAEHIFTGKELNYFEDSSGKIDFNDIRNQDANGAFRKNTLYYPKNLRHGSAYWFKIQVIFSSDLVKKQSLIEFFDQTTDEVTSYLPNSNGIYDKAASGAQEDFGKRLYRHKNFEFLIPNRSKGAYTYYFRVKSVNQINVIIVYRTTERFINHALVEYISYGLFYGMIFVFCLHNFLMFLAVRLKQYLYYVLYMLSVGMYEMSADGIAFQFIWPNAPVWNEYAYGIALYCMSIFALLFTKTLLQTEKHNKFLSRLIGWTIVIRTVYFMICLLAEREWFIYKFLEFIPLSIAFLAGVLVWYRGFKPARFFVLGYAFLFTGAIVKLITVIGFVRGLPGSVGHYSMSLGFVMEMILLSFSIGDHVRLFRREKDNSQGEVIRHMEINAELQSSINQKLEQQVAERTRELTVKSNQVHEQAEEISRMNILLEKDNLLLKNNIEKITEARIESTELTFAEFSLKYPDREQCYKVLADLKWVAGFACKKCGNTHYTEGRRPFSRRCNKCSYEESPMNDTIFENNRIPINKAFYIVYIIFTTKGNISSYQIAEKLNVRQSTCWAYAIRIKNMVDHQKTASKKNKKASWVDLILKG